MNISEAAMEETAAISSHFGIVDYVILLVVLVASVVVGIASGWRKSTSTVDFLTGGRDLNPIAVSFSLIGGVISAISVQGNSTEVYLYGTQLWLNVLGCLWGTLIVMFLILPVLYPLNMVSLCEYLEMRFQSVFVKKLGSLVQITTQFMYLGICLYAPTLAVRSTIGIPIPISLVVFGLVCAVYITLGGVRAVVYTDVLQTTIMFIGVLAVVVKVIIDLGGISRVWNIAEEGGRLQFFNVNPNPLVRHTFWSVQVLGMFFFVSALGISQSQFRRLSSVRSLRISQSICVAFFFGVAILWSLFYCAGLVAYAAYADCDPISNGQVEKADQILAHLVSEKLSHITGLVGLFVAAVAGAVLSSLSSTASAMVLLIWEDFLKGWWIFANVSEDGATKITRILSSCMVVLGICSALLVAQLGTLFQTAFTIIGGIISPFDGLFIVGIIAPWVNGKGAISGFVAALTFNLWLIIGKFYYGAGRGEALPMSTKGCLVEDNLSSSAYYNVSHLIDDPVSVVFLSTTTPLTFLNVTELEIRRSYPAVYDISYCFIGVMAITVVFIVSSLVSLFTGVVKPSDVDLRLVNPLCYRIYCWMYGRTSNPIELLNFKANPQDPVA